MSREFETVAWIAVGLIFSFLFVFFLILSLQGIIGIMRGSRKICITTTITEKIEAIVKAGKSVSTRTWHKPGDGTLEQHQLTTFYPGDTVLIEYT